MRCTILFLSVVLASLLLLQTEATLGLLKGLGKGFLIGKAVGLTKGILLGNKKSSTQRRPTRYYKKPSYNQQSYCHGKRAVDVDLATIDEVDITLDLLADMETEHCFKKIVCALNTGK